METMRGVLNLLLLQGPGKFPPRPANFSLMREEQPKATWSYIRITGGMGQNLDVLLLYEGHSDLRFVAFTEVIVTLAFWALLSCGIHFFFRHR